MSVLKEIKGVIGESILGYTRIWMNFIVSCSRLYFPMMMVVMITVIDGYYSNSNGTHEGKSVRDENHEINYHPNNHHHKNNNNSSKNILGR